MKKKLEELENILNFPGLTFGIPHAIKIIETLGSEQFLSRKSICELTFVGNGAIRTLLSKLEKLEIIKTTPLGTTLTENGINFSKYILNSIPYGKFIDKKIFPREKNFLIIIRGCNNFKNGIEQRDYAIKYGAKNVLSLYYNNGKFFTKRNSDELENFMSFKKFILKNFSLKNDDVLLITSSDDEFNAELSAKYAAIKSL